MTRSVAILLVAVAVAGCGGPLDEPDGVDQHDASRLWEAAQGFEDWERAHDGPQTRVYVEVPGVLEAGRTRDATIEGSHVVVTSSAAGKDDTIGVYEFVDEEEGWWNLWFENDGSVVTDAFRDSGPLCVGCHQGSDELFQ